jgi:uncharacterized linocin/CFP29 family protein
MKLNPTSAPETVSIPQSVAVPLTRAAIFLVVTINPGLQNRSTVRSFYLSHADDAVRLYLQESFTFLMLRSEASVVLTRSAT